jgi:hypothetical protein
VQERAEDVGDRALFADIRRREHIERLDHPPGKAFRVPPEPAQDKSLVCIAGETRKYRRYRRYLTKTPGSEEEFMLDIEVAVAKKQSNDISRKAKMGMLVFSSRQ